MLKQAQLAGITIVLVAASTAGGAYLWFQSTPQFALVEARKGYLEKESKRFNKYVDVATLTTGFTEEIIFEPAERTPKLTKLQRVIGLGALHAARTAIDNSLIFQIQNLVKKDRQTRALRPIKPVVDPTINNNDQDADGVLEKKIAKANLKASPDHDNADATTGGEPAESTDDRTCTELPERTDGQTSNQAAKPAQDETDAQEQETDTADGGKKRHFWQARPRGFGSLVRMQWKKEKQRLKNATFTRMSEFARAHPNSLINRIFAAPTGGRANAVKEILAECGFRGKNFKKYQLEKKGSKVIAHLTFYSPRIKDLVTVKLELERLRQGPFGRYRISRLVDFKETLNDLDYDTDSQIQGLVAYGLQDLTGQTIAGKAKEVMRAIDASTGDDDDDDDDEDDGNQRQTNKSAAQL